MTPTFNFDKRMSLGTNYERLEGKVWWHVQIPFPLDAGSARFTRVLPSELFLFRLALAKAQAPPLTSAERHRSLHKRNFAILSVA
jgi:hypothetical protein